MGKCCKEKCACGKPSGHHQYSQPAITPHYKRLQTNASGKQVHKDGTNIATGLSYTPAQIRTLYGIPSILNGTGIKIAIIGANKNQYAARNLDEFSTKFNLPLTSAGWFKEWPMTGVVNDTPAAGWNLEWDLDLQWSHAMAPNAQINAVYAKSASMTDLMAAVTYAVNTLKVNMWDPLESTCRHASLSIL